jgi:hypothetical protein
MRAQGMASAPGMVSTTYLGVSASPAPDTLRRQLQLPDGIGLVVSSVERGSPAEQAGLKQYDILHKIDDQLLVNTEQLSVLVHTFKPGQEVKLRIVRGGKPTELTARLGQRNQPGMRRGGPGAGFGLGPQGPMSRFGMPGMPPGGMGVPGMSGMPGMPGMAPMPQGPAFPIAPGAPGGLAPRPFVQPPPIPAPRGGVMALPRGGMGPIQPVPQPQPFGAPMPPQGGSPTAPPVSVPPAAAPMPRVIVTPPTPPAAPTAPTAPIASAPAQP